MVLEKIPLSEIGALFAVFQVAGSLVAAYLAYEVYRYDRLSRAWLSVVAALLLLSVNGLLNLAHELGTFPILTGEIALFAKNYLLQSMILLLLLFGFWGMKYKFESFEILEKRVGEKVRSFMHRMR